MRKLSVFDAHCDTISRCLETGEDLSRNSGMISLDETEQAFERYCQIFALWADCAVDGHANYRALLNCFRDQMRKNRVRISHCCTAADAEADEAHRQGKAAAFLSVEGAELLDCDPCRLNQAASDGVIAINLTWNHANALSGSAKERPEQGLTPLGRRFMSRMEELHILVDVSHLSEAGFWDVIGQAKKPVLASHSNAKSVWNHTRNLTDEQITAIIKNQGVIGLNFYQEFVGLGRDLDAVRAHLDHILSLGGANCVALGGDWDGCDTIDALPKITDLQRLYEYLLYRNYDETVLGGLFYNNLMRVVRQK